MSSDEKPHAGGQAQLFGELNGERRGKARASAAKLRQACAVVPRASHRPGRPHRHMGLNEWQLAAIAR